MIRTALERGFAPECVLFDSWHTGLDNLKALRSYGRPWRMRLKKNRQRNPDGNGNRTLETCDIATQGSQVHLHGHGLIHVFRIVPTNGSTDDVEYWATGELQSSQTERAHYAALSSGIEQYHRGLKQHCGVERSQVRAARAQRNHDRLCYLCLRASGSASPPYRHQLVGGQTAPHP